MHHSARLLFPACIVLALLQSSQAQTPSTPAPRQPAQASPAASPGSKPADGQPGRQPVSEVTSALRAGISYQPPAPAQPEVDLRQVDKPRNDIIRLPEHVVQGEKSPAFVERALYTQHGLEQLAIQRYLGMQGSNRLGPKLIAMQMYRDDERLMNMASMKEKIDLYRVSGDTAAARQLQKDADTTYIRRTEFSPPSSVQKVDFSELPK